jgi:hypothetical protein
MDHGGKNASNGTFFATELLLILIEVVIPTSELTFMGPWERTHYPANRHITPNLTGASGPRTFWMLPEGFVRRTVCHCDDVINSGVTPDTNVTIRVLNTGPWWQKG